ncbi:isoprenoid biosynthesis glyoxalase ElbB [bacterium]|nr:isoprenoid biosynthesis glyoxalase ElbB [bacterium]
MAKVAVVLSGCGYLDGAEIHESVLTLLALDRAGIPYQCLAPNIPQMHVVDHAKGQPVDGETRNVLTESARIARGEIKDLSSVSAADFSGVILPGGFGAAKNYCDYATQGDACQINSLVQDFIVAMVKAKKPVGVICISPVILARALKGHDIHPKLTIGTDPGTAKSIENFGSKHVNCPTDDCVVDKEHRIVSTPAYMTGQNIAEVAAGIERLVAEFERLFKE